MDKHSIYIMRTSEGQVLYVGRSNSFLTRTAWHVQKQPWAETVAHIDLIHALTDEEASRKEAELIGALKPVHNSALVVKDGDTLIKRKRREKGYTQMQLSKETGITQGTISLLGAGVSSPNLDTALKLARALGVPVEDLVKEEG